MVEWPCELKKSVLPLFIRKGRSSLNWVLISGPRLTAGPQSPLTFFEIYRSSPPNPPGLSEAKISWLPSSDTKPCDSQLLVFTFLLSFIVGPQLLPSNELVYISLL